MRKLIVPVALSLVTASIAQAQLSVKAGLSFASTSESDFVPDVKTRTGFAAGLSLGLPMGQIQLRPELLYVQKGGKFANDQTLELNEINVPVLLQFNVPIPVIMPYAFGGPVAEYELSCTAANIDCVDTNSLRWGFTAGAGIRLGGALSVEGRYGYTLSEISDNIKSKPRTIMLLLGIGR